MNLDQISPTPVKTRPDRCAPGKSQLPCCKQNVHTAYISELTTSSLLIYNDGNSQPLQP